MGYHNLGVIQVCSQSVSKKAASGARVFALGSFLLSERKTFYYGKSFFARSGRDYYFQNRIFD